MRERAQQQQEEPFVLLLRLHGGGAQLQRVHAVGQALKVAAQRVERILHRAGDDRHAFARRIEHVLARAEHLAGGHQRALLPPAAAGQCLDAPVRRGKEHQHAVVLAVIRAAEHDGVCGELRHGLSLSAAIRPVVHPRDEPRGKAALALLLHIEVADDREDDRADEVDHEVLHRVVDADVQVAAQAERLLGAVAVDDDDVRDVVNRDDLVAARLVELNGADGVHDGVLLHVKAEEIVPGVLEELPEHADGHGEAERDDRQIDRRELEGEHVALVEQIDQSKADGRAQKAVERMEHGIPVRHADVEAVELAEDFCGEDEQQDDDLQRAGQLDIELAREDAGQNEQHQGQPAEEDALKIAPEGRAHQREDHQRAQDEIDGQRRLVGIEAGLVGSVGTFGLFHRIWLLSLS